MGSLVVVGTGITAVTQMTLESVATIESAEKLFYSVVDPITEAWLLTKQPAATSFAPLYGADKDRRVTYREMVDAIVGPVRDGARVCVAFYGHPGVFAEATHSAIAILRSEGFTARMLPAISAEACLYADLGINPGAVGIQSYEATEFLLFDRRFDPTSGLLLWQIGVLGENGARPGYCRPNRLARMVEALRRAYPVAHEIVLYSAATFPGMRPRIVRLRLDGLADVQVPPMATLYVPPLEPRTPDPAILAWFDER